MLASWVQRVLDLQEVDLEIRNLTTRLRMIPAEGETFKKIIVEAEARQKAATEVVKHLQLEQNQLESNAQAEVEKIGKLQQQSAMVKKNTEYQAMLAQIAEAKDKISLIETQILEVMDKQEKSQSDLVAVKRECAAEIENARAEYKELAELFNEVKAALAEAKKKREPLRHLIPAEVLTAYERLAVKPQGSPLTRIAEDGTCGNCHLRLTVQTIGDAKRGQVAYCDNCMHLIYFDDSENTYEEE